MDEICIAGTARNVGGKAEEAFGRATGNTKLEAEGAVNRLGGATQDLYSQARDSASDMAETARAGTSSFEELAAQRHRATAVHRRRYRAGNWLAAGSDASSAVSWQVDAENVRYARVLFRTLLSCWMTARREGGEIR